jgi:hypothetical protein
MPHRPASFSSTHHHTKEPGPTSSIPPNNLTASTTISIRTFSSSFGLVSFVCNLPSEESHGSLKEFAPSNLRCHRLRPDSRQCDDPLTAKRQAHQHEVLRLLCSIGFPPWSLISPDNPSSGCHILIFTTSCRLRHRHMPRRTAPPIARPCRPRVSSVPLTIGPPCCFPYRNPAPRRRWAAAQSRPICIRCRINCRPTCMATTTRFESK